MSVGVNKAQFGDFELDFQPPKLVRAGYPVKIQPQPLKVLAYLVERAGEVVSREELRSRIWGEATFVEFDQGLNYCIRQIRLALNDDANSPRFIETLPKLGYRFVAPVTAVANGQPAEAGPGDVPIPDGTAAVPDAPAIASAGSRSRPGRWLVWGLAGLAACGGGEWLYLRSEATRAKVGTPRLEMKQITDFADSATGPALSPDGRMVAFFRGKDFLSTDPIYVKMLPDGEPKQLTDDSRPKYGIAFSPDGSQIAYSAIAPGVFSTYAVPVLGGETRLLLHNAAGLTWLDRNQLLFSEMKRGQHMGVVTSTESRANHRELYFPPFERAMAHYSAPSPDRSTALVVEMNETGGWAPCKIISLREEFKARDVGPPGPCTSAAWSRDGNWMYFAAGVEGKMHLWRQRYPGGAPEQLTFGPTEERGIAMDPDGRSLITSVGIHESTLWIHEPGGDRQLSSEGEVVRRTALILIRSQNESGQLLYYLVHRESEGSGLELMRMTLKTGNSERVLPGVSILEYDISPDNRQIVYTTAGPGGRTQLWLGPLDLSSEPKKIGMTGETSPYFGPNGEILFRFTEGAANYLERMNADGSGRAKVVPYPIGEIYTVSPGRHWVMAEAPLPDSGKTAPVAIPATGGDPVRMCETYCQTAWSTDGKFVYVSVEDDTLTRPGRSLALPVGPGEKLPPLPKSGIPASAGVNIVPGSRSAPRGRLVPGSSPDTFVYVKVTDHANLFRVTLP